MSPCTYIQDIQRLLVVNVVYKSTVAVHVSDLASKLIQHQFLRRLVAFSIGVVQFAFPDKLELDVYIMDL